MLEKVVFLKGYDEVAKDLKTLHVPTLTINGLFRPKKLSSPQSSSSVPPVVLDLDSEIIFPPLPRTDMDGFVPVLRKSREHVSVSFKELFSLIQMG